MYFGIKFNERETNGWTKWLLSFPMFAASVASRAFTLAVFLKETTIGIHLENANSGKTRNLTRKAGSDRQIQSVENYYYQAPKIRIAYERLN